MPTFIYHKGARPSIGTDRDEVRTPCLGAQDTYDVLMDRRGGPEWHYAIDEARRICGSCPIMAACFRENRDEMWVRAVVTRKSVHAAPGEPKQPPKPTPAAEATRARHAKAAAERLEEVRHILNQGGDVNDVCQRLNLTRSALWKWSQRHAPDAWAELRENEERRAAA